MHEALILVASGLSESELRRKKGSLTVQYFEIRGGAALVAHIGKTHGLLQVADGIFLAQPYLVKFLIADECIGNISEGSLNGLLIRDQRLRVLGFGQLEISTESSAIKNGLTHVAAPYDQIPNCEFINPENMLLRPKASPPEAVSAICGKNCAFATPISALAATRICSASRISGRRFQQRRGQPRRHLRRQRLFHQRASASHGLRIIARQNADRIFFLRNLPLQVGNLRVGDVEGLLRLQHIEARSHTVFQAEVGKLHRGFFVKVAYFRLPANCQYTVCALAHEAETKRVTA